MHSILLITFLINFITFAAFGMDKYFAIRQKRRFSEKSLLLMALFGGSVGAMAAMRLFRHKTQKFKGVLGLIVLIQIAAGWLAAELING